MYKLKTLKMHQEAIRTNKFYKAAMYKVNEQKLLTLFNTIAELPGKKKQENSLTSNSYKIWNFNQRGVLSP